MTASLEFRRGDAFSITVSLTDNAGAALTIDVADLVAQLYDQGGNLVEELTVAAGVAAGDYVLSTTADTAEWPDVLSANLFDTDDKASSTEILIFTVKQLSRVVTP